MSLERSGELTIKTAEGNPQVNPLERIASQAMDAFGTDLDPAECFLDPLTDALANGIAAVPGRSPSIEELRPLVFCATCGVTFIERS
jgi:hypothetical protein